MRVALWIVLGIICLPVCFYLGGIAGVGVHFLLLGEPGDGPIWLALVAGTLFALVGLAIPLRMAWKAFKAPPIPEEDKETMGRSVANVIFGVLAIIASLGLLLVGSVVNPSFFLIAILLALYGIYHVVKGLLRKEQLVTGKAERVNPIETTAKRN